MLGGYTSKINGLLHKIIQNFMNSFVYGGKPHIKFTIELVVTTTILAATAATVVVEAGEVISIKIVNFHVVFLRLYNKIKWRTIETGRRPPSP